jgi:hypothetical protein
MGCVILGCGWPNQPTTVNPKLQNHIHLRLTKTVHSRPKNQKNRASLTHHSNQFQNLTEATGNHHITVLQIKSINYHYY